MAIFLESDQHLFSFTQKRNWLAIQFFVKMAGTLFSSTIDPLLIHLLCPLGIGDLFSDSLLPDSYIPHLQLVMLSTSGDVVSPIGDQLVMLYPQLGIICPIGELSVGSLIQFLLMLLFLYIFLWTMWIYKNTEFQPKKRFYNSFCFDYTCILASKRTIQRFLQRYCFLQLFNLVFKLLISFTWWHDKCPIPRSCFCLRQGNLAYTGISFYKITTLNNFKYTKGTVMDDLKEAQVVH